MCDRADVWREETRVAKKRHKCSQCLGTINAGETYRVYHVLFEGRWKDYKECYDCVAIQEDINGLLPWDERVPKEGLVEHIVESERRDDAVRMLGILYARNSSSKWIDWLYDCLHKWGTKYEKLA